MIDEIVNKISAAVSIEKYEITRLIEDKQVELSGLISEEGAAYLVAKELGVHLKRESEKLSIENLMPGLQNVEITGKITRISPVREFKTEKAEGRVANVLISDNTGSINLSLWNDEIQKMEGVQLGDIIKVSGFVKEGFNNSLEMRLGRKGDLEKTESSEDYDTAIAPKMKFERSCIKDLRENMYRSIRAPIIQAFEGNVFYEICPECKKRLKEEQDGFICQEHGMIEPDYGLILTGIIDDSTGNIRAVFFGEAAEKILGMTTKDAKKLFEEKKLDVIIQLIPLGKEFVFEGKVRRNNFFDRLEFSINNVLPVDVKHEIGLMVNKK